MQYFPPGGNFGNGVVWFTIVFKVLAIYSYWPKTEDRLSRHAYFPYRYYCLFQKS